MNLYPNIKLPPFMQRAYLNSVNKQASAGYVNPQLRAEPAMQEMVRSESKRLKSLDDAGYYVNRGKEWLSQDKKLFEKNLGLRRKRLEMDRDEFKSAKRGDLISNIIGIGQLGLGVGEMYKNKQFNTNVRDIQKNRLLMQLSYMKENSPEQYSWYLSQPYIKNMLKEFNINI